MAGCERLPQPVTMVITWKWLRSQGLCGTIGFSTDRRICIRDNVESRNLNGRYLNEDQHPA
jgi:hypothetical protein